MKKWKLIYTIMFLMTIQLIQAIDTCPDQIEITSNCTMITPSLNCTSYTYDIINSTDSTVITNQADLSNVYAGIYQFNFTLGEGEYIIKLCDETIRQVKVSTTREERARMYIAIIGMVAIMALVFLGLTITAERLYLKMFFFFMLLGSLTIGTNTAKLIAEAQSAATGIVSMLTTAYKVSLWSLYLFLFLIFIYGTYRALMALKETSDHIRNPRKKSKYDFEMR